MPDDWESLNNLGNVRRAAGDLDGAIHAFRQAIALRPDLVEMVFNLSNALGQAERHDERVALMREAARISPATRGCRPNMASPRPRRAISRRRKRAYRAAIAADPGFTAAYVELGLLLENAEPARRRSTSCWPARRRRRSSASSGPGCCAGRAGSPRRCRWPRRRPPRSSPPAARNCSARSTTGSAMRRAPSPPSPR